MEPAARFLPSRPDEGGGAEEQSSSQINHEDEDEEVPCVLDIFVHEARGIHNICIYGNQDVYARLALTSAPDDDNGGTLSTHVARGGGANPRFAERLPPLRVPRGRVAVDVLKCELWMRSCARGVLDDQLLGFALVPLAAVAAADGARVVEGEFELSSTDLLHSPAGTVRLSLALRRGIPEDDACATLAGRGDDVEPSIASEVVILGPAPPVDYSSIEFTDLRVEQENNAMAVQYLPFLRTGDGDVVAEGCEMSTSPRGEKSAAAAAEASSDGSTSRNAAASTASTVSEDRAVSSSAEAAETPLPPPPPDVNEATMASVSRGSPDTPTSRGRKATKVDVFASPLGDMDMDIDMEAEESAMQRQIMEMYVQSMQQFSESLAKMQLPIELGLDDGGGGGVQKEETPDNNNKVIERQQAKKDGARVFYGCRAFF